jgi:hypothetical protein
LAAVEHQAGAAEVLVAERLVADVVVCLEELRAEDAEVLAGGDRRGAADVLERLADGLLELEPVGVRDLAGAAAGLAEVCRLGGLLDDPLEQAAQVVVLDRLDQAAVEFDGVAAWQDAVRAAGGAADRGSRVGPLERLRPGCFAGG